MADNKPGRATASMGKQVTKPWLETLTLTKLHKLAVLVGSPCSGTKPTRLEGIRQALNDVPGSTRLHHGHQVSLLSIDMGIGNLAFAHIKAPLNPGNGKSAYLHYGIPVLEAWHRISVPQSPNINDQIVPEDDSQTVRQNGRTRANTKVAKESFERWTTLDMVTVSCNSWCMTTNQTRFSLRGKDSVLAVNLPPKSGSSEWVCLRV